MAQGVVEGHTSYQIDRTNLVYATWSQGFRRGSVNALPERELGGSYVTDPGLFKVAPDKADNYELGAKGTIDNRFRYSAAIYDIQWHNVQEGAQLTPLVLPAGINIGNAYSRGFETELYVSFTSHLSGQLEYTYDKTKVTSFSPLANNVSVPLPGCANLPAGAPLHSPSRRSSAGHAENQPRSRAGIWPVCSSLAARCDMPSTPITRVRRFRRYRPTCRRCPATRWWMPARATR